MQTAKAESHEAVFRALSDVTRRRVVERLAVGPAAMTELAAPFQMALPSFQQHMTMLESCGLVRSVKHGRLRTYTLVPQRLKIAEDWLSQQRRLWETRLNQLDDYLLEMKKEQE